MHELALREGRYPDLYPAPHGHHRRHGKGGPDQEKCKTARKEWTEAKTESNGDRVVRFLRALSLFELEKKTSKCLTLFSSRQTKAGRQEVTYCRDGTTRWRSESTTVISHAVGPTSHRSFDPRPTHLELSGNPASLPFRLSSFDAWRLLHRRLRLRRRSPPFPPSSSPAQAPPRPGTQTESPSLSSSSPSSSWRPATRAPLPLVAPSRNAPQSSRPAFTSAHLASQSGRSPSRGAA
jgi:hypothetical protein